MSTYTPNGDDNERQCFDDNIPVLNFEDPEDFSSGKSSQTPHSALTTKRHRSEVWDHFTKKENNGILRAYCNYCSKHFAFKSSQGTSTLHAHLGRCSQYKCKHPENLKQKTLPSIIDSKGTSSGTLASRFDQDVCKRRLARMFIVAELPFKFVEHEELRGFLEALQPKFSLPSHRTLTRECLELFRDERGKLKRYFSSYAPRVCLTTDTWTSNENLNYMCLTCHFIDEEWNLHKRILNFCQVTGHSGEIIGKTIEKFLVSWGLTKILTITVDNASANDVGIQYLKKRFQSWNTLIMKGEFLHMRCCAHILSLTVKEGLKDIDDSIFRIWSAVRYVRLSPARTARFKNCAEEEGIKTKSLLCLDVETRWNSTYLMLETTIKFQKAFDLLDIQDEKFGQELRKEKMKGVPTGEDWEHARNILPFLKYFYDATMNISGSLYVTCNNFVNEILGVGFEIKQRCESDDMSIRIMAERMKREHDKYWSNISNMNVLLFVANVLDPRQKLYFVEWMINNVYEADIANQLSERIRYILYGMFAHYESVVGPKRKKYNQSSESTSVKGKDVKAKSHMAVFNQEVGEDCLAEKSELDRYLGEEREAFVEGEAFNVLDWWKKSAARYPVLALMAKDILAIPISIVASESAFSTGGRVLDVFRSSLTPTMVEALVCGQDWLRESTTLTKYEEDFQELEEIEKEEGFANTVVVVDPSLAALSIDD